VIKIATVNGTGSASANTLLMKSLFRSGIPVMGKNYFPSNIQGLPTWYEIRVSKDGYVARSGKRRHHGGDECRDLCARPARRGAGGYLIYDSTWPRPALLRRDRHHVLGIPLARLCNENFKGVRTRILMKNICYAGALAALLDIDLARDPRAARRDLRQEAGARRFEHAGDPARLRLREAEFQLPAAAAHVEKMDKTAGHIMIDGNTAAGLGASMPAPRWPAGTRSRRRPR
jgi:2-oxoglutarate ferredoxin oxidoreductase subunit alpha